MGARLTPPSSDVGLPYRHPLVVLQTFDVCGFHVRACLSRTVQRVLTNHYIKLEISGYFYKTCVC